MYAPTSRQLSGSEFGGVEETRATVQPKAAEALSPGERLRLGYLTGNEQYAESLEDRRQMLGLRPADGRRPNWLTHTGPMHSEGELVQEAQTQLEVERPQEPPIQLEDDL